MTMTNAETREKMNHFGWLTLKTLLLRNLITLAMFSLQAEYDGELQNISIYFIPFT